MKVNMSIDEAHKPSVMGGDSIHLVGEYDFDNSTPALQVVSQLRERAKQIGGYVTVNEDEDYFKVCCESYLYVCHYGNVEDYEKSHVKRIVTYSGDEKIDDITVEQIFEDYKVAQKILENAEFSIE